MAFPARRLDVFGGKNGLFPSKRAVVCFSYGGGCALSAMTNSASELIELVGNDRMRAERLGGNIRKAGSFSPTWQLVQRSTTAEFGKPDLLDPCLESAVAECWPRCGCESSSDTRADSGAIR